MIEASELNGTAPDADAADTATAEKPKVTRRRVTKSADAELPLEGIEAGAQEAAPEKRVKRVTRKKAAPKDETLSAEGEAAPEKPKRVTRKKAAPAGDEIVANALRNQSMRPPTVRNR